nr:1472_t:CDS:2 [Entrophospora candida]
MTIIDRLNVKKTELEKRLEGQYQGGSQGKEILQYKIEKLKELINAYGSTSSPISLKNAKQILDRQVGFEEQKKELLEIGTGKTTFSQIFSQALGKAFFTISLGGLSDSSVLIGSEANSPANNMGQLTKALLETKIPDPVILLDEIDKTGSSLKNCLVNVLDPTQNQEILDHFLEIKLDFSQNGSLNQKNFEITPDALETLINKSKEKGVRNLKRGLDKIFNHCLLQWAREIKQGKTENKITITSDLVNQVIPVAFSDVDQEISENDQAGLEKIKKELAKLKGENKNLADILSKNQNKLVKIKQKNKDLERQVKGLEKDSPKDSLNQSASYVSDLSKSKTDWEVKLTGLGTLQKIEKFDQEIREEFLQIAKRKNYPFYTFYKVLSSGEENKLKELIEKDKKKLESEAIELETELENYQENHNYIANLQKEINDLTTEKNNLDKQLKEKQDQIQIFQNHRCNTLNNAVLNQVKDQLEQVIKERNRLKEELNSKKPDIPDDKEEQIDNLTVEQLKQKIYQKKNQINELKSKLERNNVHNPNSSNNTNYVPWFLGLGGLLIAGFAIFLISPRLATEYWRNNTAIFSPR